MASIDPRVDAYIERSAEFAQPILHFLRETVHAACPEAEETLKWDMPTSMYHAILCSMAAFKQGEMVPGTIWLVLGEMVPGTIWLILMIDALRAMAAILSVLMWCQGRSNAVGGRPGLRSLAKRPVCACTQAWNRSEPSALPC